MYDVVSQLILLSQCTRCRRRKIRCSGEWPCIGCISAQAGVHCLYQRVGGLRPFVINPSLLCFTCIVSWNLDDSNRGDQVGARTEFQVMLTPIADGKSTPTTPAGSISTVDPSLSDSTAYAPTTCAPTTDASTNYTATNCTFTTYQPAAFPAFSSHRLDQVPRWSSEIAPFAADIEPARDSKNHGFAVSYSNHTLPTPSAPAPNSYRSDPAAKKDESVSTFFQLPPPIMKHDSQSGRIPQPPVWSSRLNLPWILHGSDLTYRQ